MQISMIQGEMKNSSKFIMGAVNPPEFYPLRSDPALPPVSACSRLKKYWQKLKNMSRRVLHREYENANVIIIVCVYMFCIQNRISQST